MNERKQNIAVGFTAIIATVLLFMMLLLFGYAPKFLSKGYEVEVVMPHASGLNDASRVVMNGLDIGLVRSVTLAQPPRQGIIIVADIYPEFTIPVEATVGVDAPLVGGNPALSFTFRDFTDVQLADHLPTDNTASVASEGAAGFDAIIDRVTEIADDIGQLTTRFSELAENVNTLVEPRDLAEADSGEKTANITVLIARADKRLAELESLIKSAENWVNDPQLKDDIATTAANARKASDLVGKGVDTANSVIAGIGGAVDQLSTKYRAIADDVADTMRSITGLTEKAAEGDGTAGKLLNDPELYDNLNDAAERLEKMMVEMQLLIEQWKDEGVPLDIGN